MGAGVVGGFKDAVHITAILGESVVFNCQVEPPADHPVPYVLQWEKKVGDTVGYPTHTTFSISLYKHRDRGWWCSLSLPTPKRNLTPLSLTKRYD